MIEFKYVVVSVRSGRFTEQMFIFPKTVNHDEFAETLRRMKSGDHRNWTRPYGEPISAGFTNLTSCYGRSETLNIDSRQADTELLFCGGMKGGAA